MGRLNWERFGESLQSGAGEEGGKGKRWGSASSPPEQKKKHAEGLSSEIVMPRTDTIPPPSACFSPEMSFGSNDWTHRMLLPFATLSPSEPLTGPLPCTSSALRPLLQPRSLAYTATPLPLFGRLCLEPAVSLFLEQLEQSSKRQG